MQDEKQLRICFSGASGTGKSTLLQIVNASLGLTVVDAGSREVAAEMGFKSPYDVDKVGRRGEFQQRLLGKKIAAETYLHQAMGSFISDRSILDVLAYYALHDPKNIGTGHITTAMQHFSRYTHVFYCTMAGFFEPGDDPQRLKNEGYHIIFEQLMYSFLASAQRIQKQKGWGKTEVILMPEALSLEGRVQFVQAAIGPAMASA